MKKNRHPFKVRKKNNENGICDCAIESIIAPRCLEIGICPSLKICAVFDGYRIGVADIEKLKSAVRKGKGGIQPEPAF